MDFTLKVLLLVLGVGYGLAGCPDGWDQFHEKCLIASDTLLDMEEAQYFCANQTTEDDYIPQLLTIKSRQEQSLLQKWIFNDLGLTDSAWLGARRYDGPIFKWDDNSRLSYNNWRKNYPSPASINLCVEVAPKPLEAEGDEAAGNGQWVDVPCEKANIAVCQIPVPVSFQDLQMIVMEMKNNPVPAGFVYVQLPGQPSPIVLWPSLIWKNVTEEYAGLFLRVGGGESGQFGDVQEESSTSLESVSFMSENTTQLPSVIEIPRDGSDSPFVLAGFSEQVSSEAVGTKPSLSNEGLSFKFAVKENRPRNTAVFVWHRL